jgi:hypothetical protein
VYLVGNEVCAHYLARERESEREREKERKKEKKEKKEKRKKKKKEKKKFRQSCRETRHTPYVQYTLFSLSLTKYLSLLCLFLIKVNI